MSAQAKPLETTKTQASKRSFAESYLSKIGHGSNGNAEKGTDFSATEGTDWEEVRLKRELANLEKLLSEVQNRSKADEKESEEQRMIKYEFEQLLKYKQDQYNRQQSGSGQDDLLKVENDIKDLETQAESLQEYLDSRSQELARLNQEIASLQH